MISKRVPYIRHYFVNFYSSLSTTNICLKKIWSIISIIHFFEDFEMGEGIRMNTALHDKFYFNASLPF